MNIKSTPKVKSDEVGMFLRIISLDYNPTSNKEYAKLISENFNVLCTKEDVDNYQKLCILHEDFELESRKQEYLLKL